MSAESSNAGDNHKLDEFEPKPSSSSLTAKTNSHINNKKYYKTKRPVGENSKNNDQPQMELEYDEDFEVMR